jgi:uracil-DNA glycosylase
MRFPQSGQAPNHSDSEIESLLQTAEQNLVREGGSRMVYPSGSNTSGVFLFGENPGANDAANQIQFSGPYSQLFNDKLLPMTGLSRDNIYLTNLIKCNLPGNRSPLPQEIEEWSPILLAEIVFRRPKLIVAMGKIAAEFFFPAVKITKQHGQFYQVQLYDDLTTVVYLTLHPASPYHNDYLLQDVLTDFQKLSNYLSDPQTAILLEPESYGKQANLVPDSEALF